ncbi:replication endonuclease [Atlantibacter hermannii]|uniref:replication endonuclease n=1 Tax=Atlantibacter hermannii TaxID=565 RepID=UPI0028B0194E|nr:replication endonuclease [Atlantibacter hermannii]
MTDTVFPYAWNAPRAAVGAYQADDSVRGFYYMTPDCKRKLITPMELAETDEKPDRSKAARRRLASLPHYVRSYYARQLEKMDSKGKKAADGWLLNTFERHVLSRIDHVNDRYLPNATLPAALMPLRNEFFRLLWAGKKELKRLAHSLADILQCEFMREFDFQYERTTDPHFSTLSAYGRMGFLASHLNTAVPGWTAYCNEELEGEDALKCVARLQSPQWWLNRLRRMHARWREHLMIVTGYVQAKSAPYSSEPCVQEWQAQKKANREYLNAMELEEQDTGERLSLADKVNGSIANPLTNIRLFDEPEKEMAWLTTEEVARLLRTCRGHGNPDLTMIVKICLATGARWSEAQSITKINLSPNKLTFFKTKGKKNRSVPISNDLYNEFIEREGKPFEPCYRQFYRVLRWAKIELPEGQMSHVLRHTFASHFMMKGGNILVLQRILGHSDIRVTMRYAHFAPDHLEDALLFNPLSAGLSVTTK